MATVVTLFLVMDPLGNVPLFLSVLKTVDPRRRRIVVLFLIALRMIFPSQGRCRANRCRGSRVVHVPAPGAR